MNDIQHLSREKKYIIKVCQKNCIAEKKKESSSNSEDKLYWQTLCSSHLEILAFLLFIIPDVFYILIQCIVEKCLLMKGLTMI